MKFKIKIIISLVIFSISGNVFAEDPGLEIYKNKYGYSYSVPILETIKFNDSKIEINSKSLNYSSNISSSIQQAQAPASRGGIMKSLKAFIIGPRIGLESNEGIPATFVEKANIFVPLSPFQAYGKNGYKGFLASAFLGPRVGTQLGERKIRKKEWIGLLPFLAVTYHLMTSDPTTSSLIMEVSVAGFLSRLIPAFETFRGKTMTDISRLENLTKN